MLFTKLRSQWLGLVMGVAITSALVGGATFVSAHGGDASKIHGCVGLYGVLRIVGASTSCARGEQALDWNQTGPTGATGPVGPSGLAITGPSGPSGATGAPGVLDYYTHSGTISHDWIATDVNLTISTSVSCDQNGAGRPYDIVLRGFTDAPVDDSIWDHQNGWVGGVSYPAGSGVHSLTVTVVCLDLPPAHVP